MLFYITKDNFFPNIRHLGYSKFSKNWIHFTRVSEEYILYIIIEGELFMEEEGVQYHLKEGDFFILEPGKIHRGYDFSTCKYYYFHFNQNFVLEHFEKTENFIHQLNDIRKSSLSSDPFQSSDSPINTEIIFPKHFNIKNKPQLISISSIAQAAIDDYYQKYENYKLLASANVLQILILTSREYISTLFDKEKLSEGTSKSMLTVNKLVNFIYQNYQNKLNTKTIEEYMDLNYDYLNELLKNHFKTTIGKFIQSVRINAAKMLIRETDLKFSEIAYLVGINDPYYFSKIFKYYTGLTPTKYANLIKSEQQDLSLLEANEASGN